MALSSREEVGSDAKTLTGICFVGVAKAEPNAGGNVLALLRAREGGRDESGK